MIMAKKRTAHEKRYNRRQVNMQLRFDEPAEVKAMNYIEAISRRDRVSQSKVARELLVAEVMRRLRERTA
jgi:hypothetical protein